MFSSGFVTLTYVGSRDWPRRLIDDWLVRC